MDRLAIIYDASQEAAEARDDLGADQDTPIAIFDATEALGASVVFADIDMEGIYERTPKPQVILSPYRPLVRRVFNCAHELGHHRFGHGSTIHELKSAIENRRPSEIPEEIAANAFAGFLLMPALGIQRAFYRRKLTPETANPIAIYTIASDFGVGYRTLITHLAFGLREIGEARRRDLEKWEVHDLRRLALGRADHGPLLILDELGEASTAELEVGSGILAPLGSKSSNGGLVLERTINAGNIFRAAQQGSTRIEMSTRTIDVRVMRYQYIGWSHYRYMEDPDDQ